jgi:hypothetical protein
MNKILSLILFSFCALTLKAQATGNTEKIIISTDREVYIAGDRLYFSLILSDAPGNTSNYIHVTLNNTGNKHIFTGCLKIYNNVAFGSIYLTDTLSTGIYQLVSFTNCMRNYSTSSYARKNIMIANRFDNNFSGFIDQNNKTIPDSAIQTRTSGNTGLAKHVIETNKSNYVQREKVTLSLTIPDELKNSRGTVTVRQIAPVSFVPVGRSGNIAVSEKKPCFYLPEKSGMIIQGIIKDENNNPVQGQIIFISCEDSVANLQYQRSGYEGTFRFFLNPYYFGKKLMIRSDNRFKGSIEIDDKFNASQTLPCSYLTITGDLIKFIENSQKYLTVNFLYKQQYCREINNDSTLNAYCPSVYNIKPDIVYPSQFIELPDFIEISREILPLLKLRQHDNDFVASIQDVNEKIYMNPFIFVDGVLIEHVRQIVYFGTKQIKKIECVPNIRYLGELNIPGILSITTVNREVNNLKWTLPLEMLQVENIMPLAYYGSPENMQIKHSIPDFRQLLYWEPSVTFGNNILNAEFYTSDCTGDFEVVLTGIDNKGNEFEYKKVFNVLQQ